MDSKEIEEYLEKLEKEGLYFNFMTPPINMKKFNKADYIKYLESKSNFSNAYKEILNKQQVLSSKLDTIYYRMSLLNTDKVRNNVFLGDYISKNIQDFRKAIGEDSIAEFKHYYFFITQIDSLLSLKNEIVAITNREQHILKDLNECIDRISKIDQELSKTPSLGFQSR